MKWGSPVRARSCCFVGASDLLAIPAPADALTIDLSQPSLLGPSVPLVTPWRITSLDHRATRLARSQGAMPRARVMRSSVLAPHLPPLDRLHLLPIVHASGSALGTCRGGKNYAT